MFWHIRRKIQKTAFQEISPNFIVYEVCFCPHQYFFSSLLWGERGMSCISEELKSPHQGLNSHPLQREHGVLTNGPSGESHALIHTSDVCWLWSPSLLPPPPFNSVGILTCRPTTSTRERQKPRISFLLDQLIQTWISPINHFLHSCSQVGIRLLEKVSTVCTWILHQPANKDLESFHSAPFNSCPSLRFLANRAWNKDCMLMIYLGSDTQWQ